MTLPPKARKKLPIAVAALNGRGDGGHVDKPAGAGRLQHAGKRRGAMLLLPHNATLIQVAALQLKLGLDQADKPPARAKDGGKRRKRP